MTHSTYNKSFLEFKPICVLNQNRCRFRQTEIEPNLWTDCFLSKCNLSSLVFKFASLTSVGHQETPYTGQDTTHRLLWHVVGP